MNRTDRLYALVETLRSTGESGTTSAALAARFEVSERTIKRDVLALQEAGLPIWAQSGPGGGYRLTGATSELAPVTFTAGEAAAVAVALNTQADLPFATEGAVALTKILSALQAAGEREALDRLLGRVWTTTPPRRGRASRVLDVAMNEQKTVAIDYSGRAGSATTRNVDPIQFAFTGGTWYLLAYCHLRLAGRWFRLDRIRQARLTGQTAKPHEVADVIGTPPPSARAVADAM